MKALLNKIDKMDHKKVFWSLLLLWFIVNLVHAVAMDVISDEAYYGLYGRFMAWGYYDHPPFVALMTRISSWLFEGNLGIRFMTVLMQPVTLFLIWKTIGHEKPDPKKVVTFFIVSASVVMFVAYGVITTPDVPLLFFTALFLLAYKRFLDKEDWLSVVLMAISMAGLVYSKYQAVLVVGFMVISNIRILKKYRFWLAGLMAIVLLLPHIWWQVSNGFPSFQYHLVARSSDFRWAYFLEYLPNEMAVFNPFTLGATIYLIIKYRPDTAFQKTLYFQIIGFISFFWITSFRGHVEPHWTIACSIPMIILLSEKCDEDEKLRKYTYNYILYSILLVFIVRIFLSIDSPVTRRIGYSGNDEKYEAIEEVAGDLPVIFTGSFQRPSLYPFFTGKDAVVISSLYSRQTQFDIWKFEDRYYGKRAFVWGDYGSISDQFGTGFTSFKGYFTNDLQTVNRIVINYLLPKESFGVSEVMEINFSLLNIYDHEIDFDHEEFPVELCAAFVRGREVHLRSVIADFKMGIVNAGEEIEGKLLVSVPDLPDGEYGFGLTLNTLFGPAMNSKFDKILVYGSDR